MPLMKLLRLPTEDELESQHIDFESFYQSFIAQTTAPFTAKVEIEDNYVIMDDYTISKAEWFTIVDQ